jgi:hypothetical protein
MDKNQIATLLKLTRGGFFLNALVWLVFGGMSLTLAVEAGTTIRWVYSLLMFANAMVMFWFGLQIVSGRKGVFFLAIVYMAINVVLTITDQFGIMDALILFLNLILLGLLFVARQRLNQSENQML